MCGIAGILDIKAATSSCETTVNRMIAVLRHRGPDATGIYLDNHIGMGHCRLSIIGLSTGTQPICNEDGSLWIVYNGEIFNYIELKTDLLRDGHIFETETDTEVILHLFEELGPACLKRLNGQFAFAIWNTKTAELFLARDRIGILPLFYTSTVDHFIFSSEIKAIMTIPSVPRRIDPQALYQTFTYWAPLAPKTAFETIQQLPPGHFMIVSKGGSSIKPYWSITDQIHAESSHVTPEEACEELRSLLVDAARLRLRADVPVGAYLSGGLDSSYITAIVRRHFKNHLHTFSMTFEDVGYDESSYQNEMIRALGTDHRSFYVCSQHIRDAFPKVIWHCETPLLRTAPAPLYMLAKLVRENGYKVVLTGEGADEVFGGYDIFKEAKIRWFWAREPSSRLRPLLLKKLYPDVFDRTQPKMAFLEKSFAATAQDLTDPLMSHRIRWKTGERNTHLLSDAFADRIAGCHPAQFFDNNLIDCLKAADPLSKAQAIEITTFLSSYLLSSQGDRVAMAHAIEIRPPFLDHRVIEFGLRLPPSLRLNGLDEKYLLKKAAQDYLPPIIPQRVKKPYRAPVRGFLDDEPCNDYFAHLLSEKELAKSGYFNPAKVEQLKTRVRHLGEENPGEIPHMALLGVLSTQILHEHFVAGEGLAGFAPLLPDKTIDRRIK